MSQWQFKLVEFDTEDVINKNKNNQTYGKDNKIFQITMFGIDELGSSACIFVEGFEPFFYIKVDNHWDKNDMMEFVQGLQNDMGRYYDESLTKYKFSKRQTLYGFDNNKSHIFIKLKFKSMAALNCAKRLWYKDTTVNGVFQRTLLPNGLQFNDSNVELYETQIPPLLRLFHIKNISPSGWIALLNGKYKQYDKKKTICNYEFSINYKDIVGIPNRETRVPYKILSLDIEASSSHGDFPLPQKNYKKLAMDIIDIIQKRGSDFIITSDFIRRCILTAFGYYEETGINRVFPKKSIKKTDLNNIFHDWIPLPLRNNTIIDDFINKLDEEDDKNSDNEVEEGKVEKEVENFGFKYKKIVKKYLKKGATILDLLNDNECERDTKIEELTKTFGSYNATEEQWEGLFPALEGDRVTFIGSSIIKYGEIKPYLKHCIVVGSCDPVENAEIESYKTEKEALVAWTNFIRKENPDIMIGYNIHGWDCYFMYKRAEELHCIDDFLKLSRNKGEICIKRDWRPPKTRSIEENSLFIASGQYDIRYFKMTGRIQIDLLNVFRREHQLSSYKLDYTSGYFISDDILRIELKDNGLGSIIYTNNLTGIETGDYIVIEEIGHSTDQYMGGKKFMIQRIEKDLFEINEVIRPDSSKKIRWCLGKDDVTPQDIFRLTNQGPAERAIVAKYCIKDTTLVLDLLRKVDIITGYVEMSKLCSVPMNFLVMRGQGIKLTSYVAKKCREMNTLMPVIEKSLDDEGYEGATVLNPKSGLYLDNPIACVDYSSLYPSAIISENLSHDSKVWTKEYDLKHNLLKETGEKDNSGNYIYDNMDNAEYVDINYDTYKWARLTPKGAKVKQHVGYKICRFIQPQNGNRAILPSILEELLAARKRTKKQVKEEKDPFMKNILDNRQLAIKITANSLYGQCGAKTSSFYEKDVAASTTATGRKLLMYGKESIEKNFGNSIQKTTNHGEVITNAECIYGDTDSIFFTFNLTKNDENKTPIRGKDALEITIELAQEVSKVANKGLKKPHDLEYEKTFMPWILLSKKRYVGMLYEFDINKCKRKSMGIVLKRRDNAPIVKDIYGGVIDIIMKEQSILKSVNFVKECLQNMVDEKYPIEKLIITKSLRSVYKNPQQIAHKVLADRIGEREPGNKPGSGDRIPFIFIKNSNKKALQGERIENPKYIIENKIPIDYGIYVTNQVMKPLQQLFALVLEEMEDFANKRGDMMTWESDIEKLHGKWEDEEKYNKKYDEFRNKEVKSILFDQYIKQLK